MRIIIVLDYSLKEYSLCVYQYLTVGGGSTGLFILLGVVFNLVYMGKFH